MSNTVHLTNASYFLLGLSTMYEEDSQRPFWSHVTSKRSLTPTLGSRLVLWSTGASHQSDRIGRAPWNGGVTEHGGSGRLMTRAVQQDPDHHHLTLVSPRAENERHFSSVPSSMPFGLQRRFQNVTYKVLFCQDGNLSYCAGSVHTS